MSELIILYLQINPINEIQEVKLALKGLVQVGSFGLGFNRVEPSFSGLSNVWETLSSLNRSCFSGSWAGKHCPLKADQSSPTLFSQWVKCHGFQYLRGKGQILFWYQQAVHRSIMTRGNPMSGRLPHKLFFAYPSQHLPLLEQGLSACKRSKS